MQRFGEEAGASPAVVAACRTATHKLSDYLAELQICLSSMLEGAQKQQQPAHDPPVVPAGVGGEGEHHLAAVRHFMDRTEEASLKEFRYQEDHLLLYELLRLIRIIKSVVDSVKYAEHLGEALRHDLQVSYNEGTTEQVSTLTVGKWICQICAHGCQKGVSESGKIEPVGITLRLQIL